MLAPHSMIGAEYNSWRSGASYAEQLLEGLDYEEFNITCLMPSLTIQVYVQSLFFCFFFVFVMTSNMGNCNRGDLLPVSPLILYTSLEWSMLMAQMDLLRSVSCLIILMLWAILSLLTLERWRLFIYLFILSSLFLPNFSFCFNH